MKKTNYLSILLLSVVVFASSCKKGDTGPAGAKGSTGATGAAGAAGQQGATGAIGTANVIYSDWITPSIPNGAASSYTLLNGSGPGQFLWHTKIPASAVTQPVIDNGTVLVYTKLTTYQYGDLWGSIPMQMPVSINYPLDDGNGGTFNETDTWSSNLTLGFINIYVSNKYGVIEPNVYTQFRYVIIPGGVHTLGSINPKNYQQVAQALHIPN